MQKSIIKKPARLHHIQKVNMNQILKWQQLHFKPT